MLQVGRLCIKLICMQPFRTMHIYPLSCPMPRRKGEGPSSPSLVGVDNSGLGQMLDNQGESDFVGLIKYANDDANCLRLLGATEAFACDIYGKLIAKTVPQTKKTFPHRLLH